MVDLNTHNPELMLNSLLEYEKSNGKFKTPSGDVVHSQWMHVNAQEYTKQIFVKLISKGVTIGDSGKSACIREGIFISLNRPIQETSTLILCSTILETIQWNILFKASNLKILLIKGKRKFIPQSDVYIVPKQYYHLISHLKFFRIIFFYDFPNRTSLFERCKFSYSPTEFSLIYSWQSYQTFILTPDRSSYITLNIFPMKHNETGLFNFSCWTFASKNSVHSDEFQCPVCSDIFTSILRLQCSHTICMSCLKSSYHIGHLTSCPICRASIINTQVFNINSNETKLIPSKTIQECLNECLNIKEAIIFRENGPSAEKELLKNKTKIYGFGKFPDFDHSNVNTCIIVQERSIFKKEFLTSFFRSFFNQNRKIPMMLHFIYYDETELLVFKTFAEKYFK
jgi:hypothetical protein